MADLPLESPSSAPGVGRVTGLALQAYVRAHPVIAPPDVRPEFVDGPAPALAAPEFLACDASFGLWYVRWPNGSLKWETTPALARRGILVPMRPVVGILEPEDL